MFKELSPLLAKRSLILTLSSIGDDRVRVTITPRPIGKEEARRASPLPLRAPRRSSTTSYRRPLSLTPRST